MFSADAGPSTHCEIACRFITAVTWYSAAPEAAKTANMSAQPDCGGARRQWWWWWRATPDHHRPGRGPSIDRTGLAAAHTHTQ